jgi:hypothetical protein
MTVSSLSCRDVSGEVTEDMVLSEERGVAIGEYIHKMTVFCGYCVDEVKAFLDQGI